MNHDQCDIDKLLKMAEVWRSNQNGFISLNVAVALADEVERLRADSGSVYNGKTAKQWYETFTRSVNEVSLN